MGRSFDFLDLGIYGPVDRMEDKSIKVTNSTPRKLTWSA
jgi:hypothetical protein